jgi:hypothetical protein
VEGSGRSPGKAPSLAGMELSKVKTRFAPSRAVWPQLGGETGGWGEPG